MKILFTLKIFSEKRTKYLYFNDFTSVVFNFEYDASYIIIRNQTLISRTVVNNKLASAYISNINQRISNVFVTTRLSSLTIITFPHQVSFTMVYTYLKSENVF